MNMPNPVKLNPQQLEFCRLATMCRTAAEAYRLAYPKCPAEKCAPRGARLMQNPAVIAKITERLAKDPYLEETARVFIPEFITNIDLMERTERMAILTEIARGGLTLPKPAMVKGEFKHVQTIPDWDDRRQAIAELNRMDGAYRTDGDNNKPFYKTITILPV